MSIKMSYTIPLLVQVIFSHCINFSTNPTKSQMKITKEVGYMRKRIIAVAVLELLGIPFLCA